MTTSSLAADAIRSFVYTAQAARVVFGAGSLSQLGAEVQMLGIKRVLVLCTPEQRALAERVALLLGAQAVGIFDQAVMHVPMPTVRQALEMARELGADGAVAVGGGSTTGLGKAIALIMGLPVIAIPTTYAGSEMTPIYGLTEFGLKKTGKDPSVLPRSVIYDPELTLGLPLRMSVTSGINAMAHAAEGLYAVDANPILRLMAKEGLAAMASALPAIQLITSGMSEEDHDRIVQARSQALYGAWLCGWVLGNAGMALHHKLCHTLGGSCNLPHAETHTIVLPHALAYNAQAAPQAMRDIEHALKNPHTPPGTTAARAMFDLARNQGAPTSLRDIGMQESDIAKVLDIALTAPYPNPRPLERGALHALLRNAFDGTRPN